jgi:hypothetical protein
MKLLGYILAILFTLVTAFVTLAAANKSHHLATDIATITSQLGGSDLKLLGKTIDLPSTLRLNAGALIGALGGLAALVLLVGAFAKKRWVGGVSAITIGCAALTAAIYPHIDTGPADGAAPRLLAVIAIGLSAMAALGAYLATRPSRA